ncbi:M10 family metallopeptidase C-terminal domain-containing protein [Mesorhizobium sp. LHD-90]|uniref:M10 family metallopeptidase C-terminal domain-containing protein n=1 Tax=Mesorhizobium sp. LHD-90 TaxID=3071414 RepID=UPI0027E07E63|nr:M10 family metallopeptidase C-terminal domain-containing protein [Mesorhizobium sp. LHD-90]MDQ6438272.1 M10 family metallopeptidase C-terminal domain-containing protein [Mesorhizobium sp. LHD-90]
MPDIIEIADAAASKNTAYTLGIGQTAQGYLTRSGGVTEHDWYKVNLVAGQTYTFALAATGVASDSLEDPFLRLRNSSGTQIAFDDDGGPDQFSSITYKATTTGTYYLDAGAFDSSTAGQYGISAALGGKAHYDAMMGAGDLTSLGLSWSTPGTPANVTWGVRTSFAGSTDAQGNSAPFSQLSAQQLAAVRMALGDIEDVANITFSQVNPGGTTNSATMLFSNYFSTDDGAGAYAQYPGNASASADDGDVRLNTDSVSTTDLPRGSWAYSTVLHEIGHAVGLAHPGDYNAAPGVEITYDEHAQFVEDSYQYTLMSYFLETNTTEAFGSDPDTLMLYDVLALQQLYGANMSTRTGNSVYGFGANTGDLFDFTENTDPVLCIWDAGGIDTLNVSGFSQNQVVDLRDGKFSNIGGFKGNVSIAVGAVIENTIGGKGADTLVGNAAANTLRDGAGKADMLKGLAGNDTYQIYTSATKIAETSSGGTADRINAAVDYVLAAGVYVEIMATNGSTGTAGIDLTGNALKQDITGNAGANVLHDGGAGAGDILRGLGGNDTYRVYNSGDVVIESSTQGSADKVLAAVDYALGAGVHVEFLATDSAAGTAAIDLTGNALKQDITGNAGANILHDGGAGAADVLRGLGGNDIYRVFNTADVIVESSSQGAADRIMTAVDYKLGAGVHIEVITTNGSTTTADIDLTGNEIGQEITGNYGNNRLEGKGGKDTLRGLAGDDTFVFATALGSGNVDTITDFNVTDDRFLLSDAIFTALNTGVLLTSYFRANTTGLAQDSNDHVVYETDLGRLFYDADGTGSAVGVLFATITAGLALTAADFWVA